MRFLVPLPIVYIKIWLNGGFCSVTTQGLILGTHLS
jgi:hypothetical protein